MEEPENVTSCAVTEVSRYDEPSLAEFMSSSIGNNEVGFCRKNRNISAPVGVKCNSAF